MHEKRIVVKIGSNLLIKGTRGLNEGFVRSVSGQVSCLVNERKCEIIIVTSGAVGTGLRRLKINRKAKDLSEKQAASAVGQPLLMKAYEQSFARHGLSVAQILLTRDDLNDRGRCLNLRHTILSLLQMGVVPIINENDTVAVEEIKLGDNDTLSAVVASKIDADLLVILTDIAGLYTCDPRKNRNAVLIEEIRSIHGGIEKCARKSTGSAVGTGGMYTKVQAAKIACSNGIDVVIADGTKDDVLRKIERGEQAGSRFISKKR